MKNDLHKLAGATVASAAQRRISPHKAAVMSAKTRFFNDLAKIERIGGASLALRHMCGRYLQALEAADILLGTSAENDAAIVDALYKGFEKKRYDEEFEKFQTKAASSSGA